MNAQTRLPWPTVEAFVAELAAAGQKQPREDGGEQHAVDGLVARLQASPGGEQWLEQALALAYQQPLVLSDLIRALAWLPRSLDPQHVHTWLAHSDASVRESATRLIEHRQDRGLLEPLTRFAAQEREPWLQEYMLGVVADLS